MIKKKKIHPILAVFISCLLFFLLVPIIHFAAALKLEISIPSVPFEINHNEFGLSADSLFGSAKKASTNNISYLLEEAGLPDNLSNAVSKRAKRVLKGFTRGDIYHLYSDIFNPGELLYIVFEKDPVNYVIVELKDSLRIYTGQKEITSRYKLINGEIKTSFYHSLRGNDIHAALISKLGEIYQWQIDFYRLKKGDNFKVIIEEKYAGDSLIGSPEIAAAYFNHNGNGYYAISFNDTEKIGYYDLSGKNVKKTFLKAPVSNCTITSIYSDIRFHPILKINKPHLGTDYAAPEGTPIHSVADGIVADKGFSRGNGIYIKIWHDRTYSTQYLHMSRYAKNIFPGKRVSQGETIGYVGSTGLATGPHVCFRFWKNGIQVDPAKEKMPSEYTLKGKAFDSFISRRDSLLHKLEDTQLPEAVIAVK